MDDQQARDFIEQEINAHQIVVWGKSFCPHTAKTKALFQTLQEQDDVQDYIAYDIDLRPDGDIIQQELLAMTGQRTVPNVFVMKQHIGGNDATHSALEDGTLKKLLTKSN